MMQPDLDELRKLYEASTPGERTVAIHGHGAIVVTAKRWIANYEGEREALADAAWDAAAHNAAPALLAAAAERDELRAENERLNNLHALYEQEDLAFAEVIELLDKLRDHLAANGDPIGPGRWRSDVIRQVVIDLLAANQRRADNSQRIVATPEHGIVTTLREWVKVLETELRIARGQCGCEQCERSRP